MNVMMMCDAGPSSRPLIENLDRFSVHELEQMRERQMKIVNRPRRVAAPPSDETERRRARQKVETIELRLSALRAEEEMSNPRDHTDDIADQIDLMNVGKPVQVNLKVKSKLSTRPYGMVATDPGSPTSPHGHVNGFRPAMSEAEAYQIQREAYVLASAKKEADEQRKALHADATNTRGVSDEEKRRRILAYMSFKGESDDEDDEDDDMDDDDEDGGDLFGEYDDGELDMEADDYGLGGIIQVDRSRYANFGD